MPKNDVVKIITSLVIEHTVYAESTLFNENHDMSFKGETIIGHDLN